ncbi:DUF2938 domain-containing protein [Halomonas sp. H5]|uniref:DUF2938 domain-containing protein n=1 Tax=Halomonas sp. H5 TaxID=3423910 RepID=UPI003D368FC7
MHALIWHGAVIGLGATAVMDLWALLQRRLFGVPSLDYALVGRWLGHFPRGRFRHDAIMAAPPVAGERALGWAAHYAIGMLFAALLIGVWGPEWVADPTLGPALIIGVGTVVVPLFIMQPAFGAGLAASRTPQPNKARFRSLVAHLSFGVGLYLAAKAAAFWG